MTTAGSDNEFPKILLVEGAAPAAPATGRVKLYAKADGLLYWKDDAGTEYAAGGGDVSAHLADTTDAHDASAISAVTTGYDNSSGTDVQGVLDDFDAAITAGGGGGGGTVLPLDSYLSSSGSARNDEFDDGPGIDGKWTAVGNAIDDTDENNDYAGLLLVRRNDTGSKLGAYYQNLPTLPCDVAAHVVASTLQANYCRGGGIVLLPATPGDSSAAVYIGLVYDGSVKLAVIKYSNLSTFSTYYGSQLALSVSPNGAYFRATVLSGGTSIDAYYSADGHFWVPFVTGQAVGFTIANAGIANAPEGQAVDVQSLFQWYRVSA